MTENGNHPIVGNLITSDIVKLYESNPSFSRGFDYRVYPTEVTIDISISQIPTLLHYSPIWGGGWGITFLTRKVGVVKALTLQCIMK